MINDSIDWYSELIIGLIGLVIVALKLTQIGLKLFAQVLVSVEELEDECDKIRKLWRKNGTKYRFKKT